MLSLIYFDEIKSKREFKQSCKFDERQTLSRGKFDFLKVYQVPKFYTSRKYTRGLTKQDEDIFDFTDSRLIRPPRENILNYPLLHNKVTNQKINYFCSTAFPYSYTRQLKININCRLKETLFQGVEFNGLVPGHVFGKFDYAEAEPVVRSLPRLPHGAHKASSAWRHTPGFPYKRDTSSQAKSQNPAYPIPSLQHDRLRILEFFLK